MDTDYQKNINDSFVGNETESFLNSRLDGASVQVVDDDTLNVEVTNPLCVTYTPKSEADVFDRRFQKAYSQIVAAMKAITSVAPDFLTIQSPHKQFNAFDPHNLLQPNDITLLEKVDQFNYPLLRYANLAALHREVIVVISDARPVMPKMVETMTYDELVEIIRRLKAEISRLNADRPIDCEMKLAYLRKMLNIYQEAKNEADQEGKSGNDEVTVTFPSSGGKLGEYVRCNPEDVPIVYLYYNNIKVCYPNNITNMLAYVYVHEMMHAYYDTDKSLPGSQHYIPCLEEPLAELGALRFMKAYDNAIYQVYLRDVEKKKYSASVCFYGFGAYLGGVLQDNTTLPELMYRQPKPITETAVSEYVNIWKAHIYPFNTEAETAEKMFAVFGCAYKTAARKLSDKWFILSDDGKKLIGTIPYSTQKIRSRITPNRTLYIPEGVDTILSKVFSPNYNFVEKIVFPSTIATIEPEAFTNLTNVSEIELSNKVLNIGEKWFERMVRLQSIYIPNNVVEIADNAFHDCGSLQNINLPSCITRIGAGVFNGCCALTTIKIPEGVTEIEPSTFKGCTNLTSVTIPNTVTKIGSYAFCNCHSLTTINIPDSVTEIGHDAFSGCTALTSVKMPDSVTAIGYDAFSGCNRLKSINIPNSINEIESAVFSGCTALTPINIPDSITQIGSYAFRGCTGLQLINLPATLRKIGTEAFKDCSNLSLTSIPASVEEVGDYAFEGCQYSPQSFPREVKTGLGMNRNVIGNPTEGQATLHGFQLYEVDANFILDFDVLGAEPFYEGQLANLTSNKQLENLTIRHYVENNFFNNEIPPQHEYYFRDRSCLKFKDIGNIYEYSAQAANNKIICIIEYKRINGDFYPNNIKQIIFDRPFTQQDVNLNIKTPITLTSKALPMKYIYFWPSSSMVFNVDEDVQPNSFVLCKWLALKIGQVAIKQNGFYYCYFRSLSCQTTNIEKNAFNNCYIHAYKQEGGLKLPGNHIQYFKRL